MIKLTLFDPGSVRISAILSPYVIPERRAFIAIGDAEIGITFHSRAEAEAFKARLSAAIDAALLYE